MGVERYDKYIVFREISNSAISKCNSLYEMSTVTRETNYSVPAVNQLCDRIGLDLRNASWYLPHSMVYVSNNTQYAREIYVSPAAECGNSVNGINVDENRQSSTNPSVNRTNLCVTFSKSIYRNNFTTLLGVLAFDVPLELVSSLIRNTLPCELLGMYVLCVCMCVYVCVCVCCVSECVCVCAFVCVSILGLNLYVCF